MSLRGLSLNQLEIRILYTTWNLQNFNHQKTLPGTTAKTWTNLTCRSQTDQAREYVGKSSSVAETHGLLARQSTARGLVTSWKHQTSVPFLNYFSRLSKGICSHFNTPIFLCFLNAGLSIAWKEQLVNKYIPLFSASRNYRQSNYMWEGQW